MAAMGHQSAKTSEQAPPALHDGLTCMCAARRESDRLWYLYDTDLDMIPLLLIGMFLHMLLTLSEDFHSLWYMKLCSSRGSDWKWELADASSVAGRGFAGDAVRLGGVSAVLTELFASWVSRNVCWLIWTVKSGTKAHRIGVG